MSEEYLPRVVDAELDERLSFSGAVVLEGPKGCGKTMTAVRRAKTVHRLLGDQNLQSLAMNAPGTLFGDEPPILFDEWQVVPNIWNLVKEAADAANPKMGQFLLTGSATPDDDINRHTGAGRMSMLRMRPMSLYETGHSTGTVSLRGLFDNELPATANRAMDIPAVIDRIVVGGWPQVLGLTVPQAQRWLRDYVDTIVKKDIQQLGTRRDPLNVRRLLRALGRGTGTAVKASTLQADAGGSDGPLKSETVLAYLNALERLFLTEDAPAWDTHMRSKTPLRIAPTRYLVDPSLGVAAMGQGPAQLLKDLGATGFQFESMAVRDIRVYAQPLDGTISHWRDKHGHEVDVIVELADGRWAGIEVKLGRDRVEEGVRSLLSFKEKVDTSRIGEPAFLAVVTADGASERRPDGVVVVPLTTLGP